MKNDDKVFPKLRKTAEDLYNVGGYYDRINLTSSDSNTAAVSKEDAMVSIESRSIAKKNQIELECAVKIDATSGHLVADVPDLTQRFFDKYQSQIEEHLTEEGKARLTLPDNTGFIVIAYKDEIDKRPADFSPTTKITFEAPYIVPVRGAHRHAAISTILVESPDIDAQRKTMGLEPRYSEAHPLRFTFAAVHNVPVSQEEVLLRLENSGVLAALSSVPLKV